MRWRGSHAPSRRSLLSSRQFAVGFARLSMAGSLPKTVCPSGLRGWTQVPLARAAWAQIPQLSMDEHQCAYALLAVGS